MKKFNEYLYKYLINPLTKIFGVALLLVILLQIFGRTFMETPPPWTEEMSRFVFVWFCFLGCALTLRQKQHLGLDFFYNKFGNKLKRIVDFINQVFIFVFGVYIAFFGYNLLDVVAKRTAPITSWNMKWFYLVLPIMGVLFVLQSIEEFIDLAKSKPVEKEEI